MKTSVMSQVEQINSSRMSGRWDHLQYVLCRGSPLAHPDFEPSAEVDL